MKRQTQLRNIIRLAQNRRDTLLKRLDRACETQDEIRADQLLWSIASQTELMQNAARDLEAAE